MSAIEQEIMNRLHEMSPEDQQKVLNFIDHLGHEPNANLTALELMRLPPDERDRLVAEAFARAADEDFEVFEGYSEEAVDDES